MIYTPQLRQAIDIWHMEQMTGEKIDDKEWVAFCEQFIDAFAEEVSLLAKQYWSERSMYKEMKE